MTYWCVNCGEVGRTDRKVVLCPHCDYAGVSELDEKEFDELCVRQGRKKIKDKVSIKPKLVIETLELKGVMG
jgi:hypothetical protein